MRPLLPTSALLATLFVQGVAAASPPAMMCSDEQTISEEVSGSELVAVGELTALRKSINGTMVTVEADFKVSQTLYSAPGTKSTPSVTVVFTCDSAPIPENLVGYPSVANYCNETGMPKTMPAQVSVLTLKTVDHKLTLVKRFVWGGCVDLAELKKKSPHVAGVVAKIRALKLPAPTASAPPVVTAAASATAFATATATPSTTATSVPPVNTIAPAVTVPPPGPPAVAPKSSGCTMHTYSNGSVPASSALILAAGLVIGGIARKKAHS